MAYKQMVAQLPLGGPQRLDNQRVGFGNIKALGDVGRVGWIAARMLVVNLSSRMSTY